MDTFTRILLLSFSALVIYSSIQLNEIFRTPPLPELEDEWWGPGQSVNTSKVITPFKINVSDEVLEDLRNRLKNTRTFLPPLEGTANQYGFNTNTLKLFLDYWLKKYNWREREQFLNTYSQFKTKVQGLNIHYVHVKPSVPEGVSVYPLLMVHGWPGCTREFYKVIPILTKVHEKYGFAFEVIAPSLPGFGFSDTAVRPGLGSAKIALLLRNLMNRIGYEKFYVQGGDWGSIIIKNMATLFPDNILGLHTNMGLTYGPKSLLKILLGSLYSPFVVSKKFDHKLYPLLKYLKFYLEESGYFHLHATKPDSIGVGMEDSPAGLASYILEKISIGTNVSYKEREDAGLLEKFNYDELLDIIMFYWIPKSFSSSCRLYAESVTIKEFNLLLETIPIDERVPCAVARFPNEIVFQPEYILKDKYTNLVQVTDFAEGGHFAALEVPQLFAEDIFLAVYKIWKLKEGK